MNRKFNGVLLPLFNSLLVLAILSGCTAAGTVSETATPPMGKTSTVQSNESRTPDPTMANTISETGTPPARETTAASTAGNSTHDPTPGGGTAHPVPQELKIIPEAYYQAADSREP